MTKMNNKKPITLTDIGFCALFLFPLNSRKPTKNGFTTVFLTNQFDNSTFWGTFCYFFVSFKQL